MLCLKSAGPKTAVDKANSSLDAIKTALTGQTVLPTDEVEAVLATQEESDYFEQQFADWITVKCPNGFVLSNSKIIRPKPETKAQ